MTDSVRKSQILERLLYGLLLIGIFWAPLPFGSNTPWAESLLGIYFTGLCCAFLVFVSLGWARFASWNGRVWVFLLIYLLWALWVSVPLLVHKGYIDAPALNAVDYAATRSAWLLTLTYLAAMLLVLGLVSSSRRVRGILWVIVIGGVLQAVYGVYMVTTGTEYSFFRPKQAYFGVATGTFVNRNHFAGYLELSLAAASGLVLPTLTTYMPVNWRRRLLSFLNFFYGQKVYVRMLMILMVIGLLLSQSRMGNTAFVAALLTAAIVYLFARRMRPSGLVLVLIASVLIVDIFLIGQWYGLEKVAERIEQTRFEAEARTYLTAEVMDTWEHHSPYGVGLGGFTTVFQHHRQLPSPRFWDHAHNDYLQFLIETGWPGVAFLGVLVLYSAFHAFRVLVTRRRSHNMAIGFAAIMAMVSIGLHSLVDFNLQIPANALTLLVLMTAAMAVKVRKNIHLSKNRTPRETM